ncbi:MAG TPA: TonB family protein [Thermoanaerobaculia bacterium]|nr:TonB family protein [Thermoanaerobaculia bacterium]
MEEHLELIVEAKPRGWFGASGAIVLSLVLHVFIAVWIARNYHPVTADAEPTQILHYVELMRQAPRELTEAPGQKVEKAPMNAPFSDANRRASSPTPTGDRPTTRPGDDTGLFTPPMPSGDGRRPEQARPEINQPRVDPAQTSAAAVPETAPPQPNGQSQLIYRPQEPQKPVQANAGAVDWRNAIRSVGSASSSGSGPEGMDLNRAGGGEKGFAESGPLSFETQWYDWGEYAQSMVSRIRVNWYGQMPPLIRTGMKGVVTIRFTIQRSGRITNVEMLNSSGVPPYDFAARKAIELSSPLNPLPKDFPNESERVTCMFYYNQEVPNR